MTKNWLLVIYALGFVSCFYLGMRFEAWRFRKQYRRALDRAYNRGWKAGYEHLTRIQDRKLDMDSAIRILSGDNADEQRHTPEDP